MTYHKRGAQYSKPLWLSSLEGGTPVQLVRRLEFTRDARFTDGGYDELRLQRLVHKYPTSLPIAELEPGIGSVIPVAMEVPTPAGYVDNVFVTKQGNIVLAECKLWRNSKSRHEVVGQILNYAQSMSRWHYQDLDDGVRKGKDAEGKPVANSLADLVASASEAEGDFDESRFQDAIEKNLRMGRMLLLIVGDGVREGAESLTHYLQMHAGFHFTLGLIEFSIFDVPGHGFFVQPRILARTLNIERAIVKLSSNSLAAEAVEVQPASASAPRAMSMTEELYFEKLGIASPETPALLREFLSRTEAIGVFLDIASKSASLKWESPNGKVFSLGGIDTEGRLVSYAVGWAANEIGHVQIAHDYLDRISKMVGGSVKKTPNAGQWNVVKNGKPPPALELLRKAEDWIDLITEYQARLAKASDID